MKFYQKHLLDTLHAIKKSRIAVVGDVIVDKFVHGDVKRISPESPVPVLNITHDTTMLGGAGNTLTNLASLGGQTHFIAVCGDDEPSKTLKQLLSDKTSATLINDKTRPTSIKTRFLSGPHHLLRSDYEDTRPVSEAISGKIQNKIAALMPDLDCIILSDYGKGVLTRDTINFVMDQAVKHHVKVIVDPKGTDFSKYRGAYAITPNKKELYEASQLPVETDEDITAAARHIIDICGIQTVIATRSAQGISVVTKGKDAIHIPTLKREVFDVSGAGDTVIATLTAALATNDDPSYAAMLANIAGGIVVSKVGTAIIRPDEIEEALYDKDSMDATGIERQTDETNTSYSTAYQPLDEVLERVARWRAKGLKIGFTNGCFDILHQGHVSYLNNARSLCDRLILGLNHDKSVKILKGEERPIHDEYGRALVLSGLKAIDAVTLFGAEKPGDDNTAITLLNAIKPDIYFKGGDYEVDDIPETPTVRAYGGEVRVLNEVKGQSTTNSLAKIKAAG